MQVWEDETDFTQRDYIIAELKRRNLFPTNEVNAWNKQTGAYPDIIDPEFLQKLLAKREFADSLQSTWKPKTDPCSEEVTTFEVTPVQRFISNFMSPKTPYMSALLYHGVGVGKTCAAICIAEAWLEFFPNQQVIIVTPPTIKKGFLRTIFDIGNVTIGDGNEPNSASQCTGINYLKLTNSLFERDRDKIKRRVDKLITKRYKFYGYIAFANYINETIKYPPRLSEKKKELYKKDAIRNHFSGRCIIVDEAHNLRDIDEDEDEDAMEKRLIAGKKSDEDNAKMLTPYLRYVLQYAEGTKFCALTATPMYNTYREIIFMFNLLLLNDKKALIKESDIFTKEGELIPKGAEMIANISNHYVSFMRGENPISFPVRLFPQIDQLDEYPMLNPRGIEIDDKHREYYKRLPIVPIPLEGDALKATIAFTEALEESEKGLNTIELEKLVHACTFIVPVTPQTQGDTLEAYLSRTNRGALETVFTKERNNKITQYRAKPGVPPTWLREDQISQYAPKFKFLLERLRTAEGCCFVYSRFVNSGAIPIALVLEANGYTPYGGKTRLLANGIQVPGGRQCALCPRKEDNHANIQHEFTPAMYGLLTGDTVISPNNEATISAQRASNNVDGKYMKVLIGSQISSEGVDLRFIREMHLIDAWYHLNKTEQILGRGIRFLSHCLLPEEKRNNTVYLYAATIPDDTRETCDLYSYRLGFTKAVLIGRVTRIMKQSALDCNLNHDAIIISGQDPIDLLDSQRVLRDNVDINDMPYTAICDWIENCDYKCNPSINVKTIPKDDSSFDEFSSRWRMHQIKETIKQLFKEQPFYQIENIREHFTGTPDMALIDVFNEIINNKTFQVSHNNIKGYIRYCNGYYIFQPNVYSDLSIPLAIRSAQFPVKRDVFTPVVYEASQVVVQKVGVIKNIDVIWTAIEKWITYLSTNRKPIQPPVEIDNWRIARSDGNQELLKMHYEIITTLMWFHHSFHRSQNQEPASFRRALLFYLWDEWLSINDQKWLLYSSDLDLEEFIADHQYTIGKTKIYRFIEPVRGEMEFMCVNDKECKCPDPSTCTCKKYKTCDAGIIDFIESKEDEPIRTIKINNDTAGALFGFIVSKHGTYIMKHDKPTDVNMERFKGLECANRSGMTGHIQDLVMLGEILEENGMGNFELTTDILKTVRKIANARCACTLIDFILRYMNDIHLDNKRWFFRSVEAAYIGYKGTFKPE